MILKRSSFMIQSKIPRGNWWKWDILKNGNIQIYNILRFSLNNFWIPNLSVCSHISFERSFYCGSNRIQPSFDKLGIQKIFELENAGIFTKVPNFKALLQKILIHLRWPFFLKNLPMYLNFTNKFKKFNISIVFLTFLLFESKMANFLKITFLADKLWGALLKSIKIYIKIDSMKNSIN